MLLFCPRQSVYPHLLFLALLIYINLGFCQESFSVLKELPQTVQANFKYFLNICCLEKPLVLLSLPNDFLTDTELLIFMFWKWI